MTHREGERRPIDIYGLKLRTQVGFDDGLYWAIRCGIHMVFHAVLLHVDKRQGMVCFCVKHDGNMGSWGTGLLCI